MFIANLCDLLVAYKVDINLIPGMHMFIANLCD